VTRLIGELVECRKHSFDVAVRESGSEHSTLVKMIFACFRKESASFLSIVECAHLLQRSIPSQGESTNLLEALQVSRNRHKDRS